jgi:CDP-glucose 4,6-dehydratase
MLGAKLFKEGAIYAQGWNFGPDDHDAKNVEWIVYHICKLWGNGASYEIDTHPQPHEANYLKLDCSKAKTELSWYPRWNITTTLKSIVEWNKSFLEGANMREITDYHIEQYFSLKDKEAKISFV